MCVHWSFVLTIQIKVVYSVVHCHHFTQCFHSFWTNLVSCLFVLCVKTIPFFLFSCCFFSHQTDSKTIVFGFFSMLQQLLLLPQHQHYSLHMAKSHKQFNSFNQWSFKPHKLKWSRTVFTLRTSLIAFAPSSPNPLSVTHNLLQSNTLVDWLPFFKLSKVTVIIVVFVFNNSLNATAPSTPISLSFKQWRFLDFDSNAL